jgi:hypothetical protein
VRRRAQERVLILLDPAGSWILLGLLGLLDLWQTAAYAQAQPGLRILLGPSRGGRAAAGGAGCNACRRVTGAGCSKDSANGLQVCGLLGAGQS